MLIWKLGINHMLKKVVLKKGADPWVYGDSNKLKKNPNIMMVSIMNRCVSENSVYNYVSEMLHVNHAYWEWLLCIYHLFISIQSYTIDSLALSSRREQSAVIEFKKLLNQNQCEARIFSPFLLLILKSRLKFKWVLRPQMWESWKSH